MVKTRIYLIMIKVLGERLAYISRLLTSSSKSRTP